MNIIDDIKLQYKIGGIANRVIYWNVVIFLISIYFYNFSNFEFNYPDWLAMSSNFHRAIKFSWTFLTYAFLHAGFWHLLTNMMVLNFSSRLFLTFFTQKQFLGLYFLSAIFAGICFVIFSNYSGIEKPLVGASGAIMAILVATTAYEPLMMVNLALFGNIKLYILTGIILLKFLLDIGLNTGGHVAHFGGAFFGVIYIKLLQNGTDLSNIVSTVIDFFVNLFQPSKKTPFKRVHVNPKKPVAKAASKIVVKDKSQQQIDEILDKISQSGYDSLTAEEKEFLFKAGK